MTDDGVRQLVAEQPQATLIQRPPRTVAVLTNRFSKEQQPHVARWVKKVGGDMGKSPDLRTNEIGVGETFIPGELYYVIPVDALSD